MVQGLTNSSLAAAPPQMLLAVLGLAEAGDLERNEIRFDPALLERYAKFFAAVRGDPCYDSSMSTKLSSTNPYLRAPTLRQRMVLKSVATSSAIEGIHAPFRKAAGSASGKKAAKTRKPDR